MLLFERWLRSTYEPPIDWLDVYGLDDPRFEAATILANAYRPALDAAQALGYGTGYTAGRYDAEREMSDNWHQVWLHVRAEMARPTHARLKARRGEAS